MLDLTAIDSTKLAKKELSFRYLWTSQGRIRIRQDSESRAVNISSPEFNKFTNSCY